MFPQSKANAARGTGAILALLVAVGACGENEAIHDAGLGTDRARLAPFHGEVVLPNARHAQPWKPPEAGPVPVVEVLRDGTWIVDGASIRQDAGDPLVSLRKLLYEQARRMPQVPLLEEGKGPRVPGNPLFLRTDRDAPWSAVRPVIASCALQGISVFELDIQVASDGQQPRIIRLALPRVMGHSHGPGEPHVHSLILEAGTSLPHRAGSLSTLPVDLELQGLEYGFEDVQRIDRRFRDIQAFVEGVRQISQVVRAVEILLPESAPAWLAILAVDLATEAGVTYAEASALSLDEIEKR